jgi:flavin reductase (DIM6/NTAB) family NADH-FMN oxidoreductase RutF
LRLVIARVVDPAEPLRSVSLPKIPCELAPACSSARYSLWNLYNLSRSSTGFAAAGHFAVNILAHDQQALCARFATSGSDKRRDIAHEIWQTVAPILPGSLANLDCRVGTKHEGGNHVIFGGRVVRVESRPHGEPLLFNRGTYRALGERLGVVGGRLAGVV